MVVKKQKAQAAQNPGVSIPAILYGLMFLTSFYISKVLTDPFIVAKNYFYFFALVPVVIFISCYALTRKYKVSYSFNFIDLSLLVFTAYFTLQCILSGGKPLSNMRFLMQFVPIVIYFIYRPVFHAGHPLNSNQKFTNTLYVLFLFIVIFQSLYGLLQYFGIIENLQKEFKIGGSFGNPGAYANFIVLGIPVALSYIVFSKRSKQRILAIVALIAIVITLPLTNARTAWIASIAGVIYVVLNHPKAKQYWIKNFSSLKSKLIFAIVITVFLIAGVFFMTSFKHDSASGRLFVWKVTLQMIKDKPVFGHGFSNFAVVHNNYQADYFRENPNDEKNANLADGVNFAFNDYLQMASEVGLFGLIFLLLVLFFVFRNNLFISDKEIDVHKTASMGIIVVGLVSSLFSYPLQSLPVLIVFYTAIGIIAASKTKNIFSITTQPLHRQIISAVVLILLFLFSGLTIKRYKSEKMWVEAFKMIREGKYDEARKTYRELYPVMKYNEYFLYNYGAELSVMGNYKESVVILKETEPRLNDADFWIYYGNSLEGVGDFEKAKNCYEQASYIMPVKFYPVYRLVFLYEKFGNINKALECAHRIVNMKVKIESEVVQKIKSEMEVYIAQHTPASSN